MKSIFVSKLSKSDHLKSIFFRLFILCSIVCSENSYAQNCLDKITYNSLYSGSNNIINGRKWIYEKKYLGSPLLLADYWPKADISYNGTHYTGVVMNYDVLKNEIIVYHPEKDKDKYVLLSIDSLSGFSYIDTVSSRKHIYENTELSGIKGKALYENASAGKISFYIKPIKTVQTKAEGQGAYSDSFEYYINVGNVYRRFRSKSQFVKLLPNHSSDLKRYLRKNKLKISDRYPGNIVTALKYYIGLN